MEIRRPIVYNAPWFAINYRRNEITTSRMLKMNEKGRGPISRHIDDIEYATTLHLRATNSPDVPPTGEMGAAPLQSATPLPMTAPLRGQPENLGLAACR